MQGASRILLFLWQYQAMLALVTLRYWISGAETNDVHGVMSIYHVFLISRDALLVLVGAGDVVSVSSRNTTSFYFICSCRGIKMLSSKTI